MKEEEKTINCITQTTKAMPFAVGAMFIIMRSERKSSKHVFETMATSIKDVFKDNLNNIHRLDEETRILLKDKVDAISYQIGKH